MSISVSFDLLWHLSAESRSEGPMQKQTFAKRNRRRCSCRRSGPL